MWCWHFEGLGFWFGMAAQSICSPLYGTCGLSYPALGGVLMLILAVDIAGTFYKVFHTIRGSCFGLQSFGIMANCYAYTHVRRGAKKLFMEKNRSLRNRHSFWFTEIFFRTIHQCENTYGKYFAVWAGFRLPSTCTRSIRRNSAMSRVSAKISFFQPGFLLLFYKALKHEDEVHGDYTHKNRFLYSFFFWTSWFLYRSTVMVRSFYESALLSLIP